MPKSIVKNIDCMIWMREFPDKFFDLLLTDIPYGLDVGNMAFLTEINTSVRQKNGTQLKINKKAYQKKDWDKIPPPQEYFDEVCRVSNHQIIFGANYANWQSLGSGRIQWNKGFADGVSFKPCETAYCSLLDCTVEINLLWAGMMQAASLDNPMKQQGNKKLNEKRIHPTQKPSLLFQKLLKDYAKPNYKILDTHLGSQSSRLAAYQLGFDFWGSELDADYFQSGNERFEWFINQPVQATLF
jgi:site-specific DNA-methyltransferase (adenine-specific)